MEDENRFIKLKKEKLKELIKNGINPYPYRFDNQNTSLQIFDLGKKLNSGEKSEKKVKIAGRIMNIREMGKASFVHIQDNHSKIQLYIREEDVSKEIYNDIFMKLDIGDIIGVEGTVFKTKLGETTVYVKKLELLCKSLRPLPEKWHGLKDIQIRYRKRYLDLIMNPEVKQIFITRSKVVQSIRNYLNNKSYLEVDTPCLQSMYGGANARPFKTHLNSLKMDVYLRISNELYLKRLIVGGFDRVYEFAKDFRNEDIDRTHNPEFTQVEFYQAYADYNDMMDITEDLIVSVAKEVSKDLKFKWEENTIDLKKPWKRMTMKEAISKFGKIDIDKLNDTELQDIVEENNIEYDGELTRGLAIQLIFEKFCEDKLIQPTFIIDHPIETTPLCKPLRTKDKSFVERFELFIAGMEFANAYTELNDPILQRELLEKQAKQLRAGAEEAHPMDEDFIECIEYGMPPTGGVGIGVDRLIMLLTNSQSIRDVIFFPFMRPEQE